MAGSFASPNRWPVPSTEVPASNGHSRHSANGASRIPLHVFFAHSEPMRRVQALIAQAAATDATVLIEGESGAGKSLVAYALHAQSARGARPLVKVNCATLPAELLESELFGHERGAFTGAHRRKPGKFELAHEGTLFLDEVGELPPALQAKLLQVLQDGEFTRLGGTRDLRVDVRVLAATNRQLAPAVAAGTFRADLYYRLNVVRLEVPPLRARREEIPFLVEHFLRVYAARYDRLPASLAPETLARFLTYAWPGNVRELENLVKRIVVLEDEAGVRAELEGGRGNGAAPGPARWDLKAAVRRATREVERALIQEALQRTHWNRAAAARLLGISTKAPRYKVEERKTRLGSGGGVSARIEARHVRPTLPARRLANGEDTRWTGQEGNGRSHGEG